MKKSVILKVISGSFVLEKKFVEGEGLMNGTSKCRYSNGDVYIGEFEDGVPHGYGEMKYVSGKEYKGLFYKGNKTKGKLIIESGVFVEGEWKNDVLSFGKIFYDPNSIYEGEISNNKANGFGILWKQGKTLYSGYWKNNKFLFSPEYDKKIENFNNFNGIGIVDFKDNKKYRGMIKNGVPNGEGIIYDNKDQIIFKGIIRQNEMIQGIFYKQNYIYVGSFIDENLHNKGLLIKIKNNQIKKYYKGKWNHGVFKKGEIIVHNKHYRKGKLKKSQLTGYSVIFIPNEKIIYDQEMLLAENYTKNKNHSNYERFENYFKYMFVSISCQWKVFFSGQIKKGRKNGFGEYHLYGLLEYKGNFIDDNFHGLGCLRLENEFYYSGEFKSGRIEGFGYMIYFSKKTIPKNSLFSIINDIKKYLQELGSFDTNKKVSLEEEYLNEHINKDYTIYIGEFIDSKKSGFGTFIDQRIFKGEFFNDLMHGYGKILDGSQIIEGRWKNGSQEIYFYESQPKVWLFEENFHDSVNHIQYEKNYSVENQEIIRFIDENWSFMNTDSQISKYNELSYSDKVIKNIYKEEYETTSCINKNTKSGYSLVYNNSIIKLQKIDSENFVDIISFNIENQILTSIKNSNI